VFRVKKKCLFYDTLFTHFKFKVRELSSYRLNTTHGMKIFVCSSVDVVTVKRLFQLEYKHFAQDPEIREYVSA
jgi:hypothetical protein